MALNYREVGATAGDPGQLPEGYQHLRYRLQVGTGPAAFTAIAGWMREWGVHRGAGLRVRTDGPPNLGRQFSAGVGAGPLRLWVPGEIVWRREDETRFGYGFGTLPGHPERGEEAFDLSLAPDQSVWFEVRAFSRPARWYAHLGGPFTRLMQRYITRRYITGVRRVGAVATRRNA